MSSRYVPAFVFIDQYIDNHNLCSITMMKM
jgi:hypothetical protein